MSDLADRLQAAIRACPTTVFWRRSLTPEEWFVQLAEAARELGAETDVYGDGGVVTQLEQEVAELLGQEAALLFPGGIMGQQAALRVWCDRTGSSRVALPDLSHLLHHEGDGPRLLHGFEFTPLTVGPRAPTVADLDVIPGLLGAVLVELPLRDGGCLLPSWAELEELSARCREVGVPLHADGARIWESQPHFDRPLAEIGTLFDSIYVSLYKGLGGPHGALVAGPADFVAELKPWRKRMGGTLFRMAPMAVAGLHGLRAQVPRMGEYVAWARSFADELRATGFRVDPPAAQTFWAFADGEADAVNERLVAFIEEEGWVPSAAWQSTGVPGVVRTEFAVYADALSHDPAQVAAGVARVVHSDS